MRSRLRSLTGCLRCRQRRTKCGEEKPICAQCHRLRLACVYALPKSRSDILSSQRHLKSLRASLMIQKKFGKGWQIQPTSRGTCPARAISSGFEPPENGFEHMTLLSFRNFLDGLQIYRGYCVRLSLPPPPHHELTVALTHPWVRKPLLAFATTVVGVKHPRSSSSSYERYDVAVQTFRAQLSYSRPNLDHEQLLVAAFLMALIEANHSSPVILPCTYFQMVGQLLCVLNTSVRSECGVSAKDVFHRIAFESYLAQLSTAAFFRPERCRSVRMTIPYPGEYVPSSALENIRCPHDLNAQCLLFKISQYTTISSFSPEHLSELQHIGDKLQGLRHQYLQQRDTCSEDAWIAQFKPLTLLAISALQIYYAKIRKRCLSSDDPEIQSYLHEALDRLQGFRTIPSNTGDIVWILAILLCTVDEPDGFQQVCDKIDELRSGMWGIRLEYLISLLTIIQGRMAGSAAHEKGIHGETVLGRPDNLALLLRLP